MPHLVVRRLLIDLEASIPRHWNGGDAFRTAFFDALSMSFPVGEQFFIDSVRAGLRALPEAQRALFEDEVRGFIGQEATHRRIHALYNGHLARQGLVNRWEARALKRIRALDGLDLRTHLGVTAATEHFTAIFAERLLTHDGLLAGAEPRLLTLWRWHAAVEREGMRRARGELARADLAIVVVDARDPAAGRAAVADALQDVPQVLWVHNKADLLPAPAATPEENAVWVSARTGDGLPALHARLRALALGTGAAGAEGTFTARARHVDALQRAQAEVAQARMQLDHEALDLAAEALRLAHDRLGEITGRVLADDLLGHIFASFCIGK